MHACECGSPSPAGFVLPGRLSRGVRRCDTSSMRRPLLAPRIAAALVIGLAALVAQVNAQTPPQAGRLPLFDAHLHYNDDALVSYPVADVLARFRHAGVTTILATSRPNDGTRALVAAAAAAGAAAPRVVPFIRPYRDHADRVTWFDDPAIYALIESELLRPIDWRGIGEFHVFGRDAATPWVRKHPNLIGELSYRYDVTVDGKLAPEWRALFLRHPDRFVIGSDTWINGRWAQYGEIMDGYRGWLAQLPPDVAAAIAHRNGERLFANGR